MNTPLTEQSSPKLHVGCGTNKLPGWVNIDSVSALQPDLVHDITTPLPFQDLTVDQVLAEDLLEHFDKYQRFVVFYEWARVLKVSGVITIQVPNFKKLMFRFFKFGWNNFIDQIFGENMWRSQVYLGHFGNHKWAYTESSLVEFVKNFGIEPTSVQTSGLNIRLVGEKTRHVPLAELDQVLIHSHANSTEIGRGSLALGVVRDKIKIYQENLGTKK